MMKRCLKHGWLVVAVLILPCLEMGCSGDAAENNCSRLICTDNAHCEMNNQVPQCVCNSGYDWADDQCVDIDECVDSNGDCGENQVCVNLPGSSECRCKDGYIPSGDVCIDIDECANNNGSCGANASCVNLPGSFECKCNNGYVENGGICVDINECFLHNGGCGDNAVCVNLPGGFECRCKDGFTGQGDICVDVNECNQALLFCDENAVCQNLPGSFTCRCLPGFLGDGFNCEEVAAVLDGLRWEMPCQSEPDNQGCTTQENIFTHTANLSGAEGVFYDVTLRFRGVVETEPYDQGTQEGFWYTGGQPADAYYNIYKLHTSSPDQTFYLNAGQANLKYCFLIDYQRTIRVAGGSVVTLSADAQDHYLVVNVDEQGNPFTVPEVPPYPQTFDGQFIQMDVVSVVRSSNQQ